MNRIVIGPKMQQELSGASQTVELVDPNGKLLGDFVPAHHPHHVIGEIYDCVIVDPDIQQHLSNASQSLELCDSNGRVLGKFIPLVELQREPFISEEELQRRISQGGGRPLSAILADLEKRA
jgi:hypothetical protein